MEGRVLPGLRDRMMTPEMAAEAMRAHAEEANRLNRERRNAAETIATSLQRDREGHRRDRALRQPHPCGAGQIGFHWLGDRLEQLFGWSSGVNS